MAPTQVSLLDLARDPGEVARGLVAWHRGDPDDAAVQTLETSGSQLHARSYTLWVWTGRSGDGHPTWLLPIAAAAASHFAPRGPARALLRCLDAAVLHGGADPQRVRLEEWRGLTCLVAPGMDEEFAAYALADLHPPPSRAATAAFPPQIRIGGPRIAMDPIGGHGDDGVLGLAQELGVHPVRVALALISHGQPAADPSYPGELVASLREWGCSADTPQVTPVAPSLEIADDLCPRRRHARKVLQRLLRMGKVGAGYHTEFDHLYRGAPANERQQALEVGEALLRAGLLGEKPSVGQRHVYLRREALPHIHSLIDRADSGIDALEQFWTTPMRGQRNRAEAT